jgi:hypothetical protein
VWRLLEPHVKKLFDPPKRDRWARLRFSVIGALMASPPEPGRLRDALLVLAAKTWRHPDSGLDVRFGVSTLERWYYAARRSDDPLVALRDRLRGDEGRFPSMSEQAIAALTAQYREHSGWTAAPGQPARHAAGRRLAGGLVCDGAAPSTPAARSSSRDWLIC